MTRQGTVNSINHDLASTMRGEPQSDARGSKFSRLIDWLGSARRHNETINDEVQTLKFEVEVLRWANKELRRDLAVAQPFIIAGRKRKAADKKYREACK